MVEPRLARKIGLFDATMIMVGMVIGSGIFLSTGMIASSIPSSGLILLAWVSTDDARVCARGCQSRCGGLRHGRSRKRRGCIRFRRSSDFRGRGSQRYGALGRSRLLTLVDKPVESLAGLGILVLGLPAYWYWKSR